MPDKAGRRAVLIAGPTASGKSALALRRARDLGGVVVNADAMQIYDVLQVLTARPDAAEAGDVPHLLYGMVPPSQRFSTGAWQRAVAELLPRLEGRPLVFVGGTGLYFEALTQGLAAVPEVPAAAVAAPWLSRISASPSAKRASAGSGRTTPSFRTTSASFSNRSSAMAASGSPLAYPVKRTWKGDGSRRG